MNSSNFEVAEVYADDGSIEKPNEDLTLLTDGMAAVFDGATGLGAHWVDNAPSDAHWFVNRIASYLTHHWLQTGRFTQALDTAIHQVEEEFTEILGGRDIDFYEHPSAGVMALALEAGQMTLYRAGDCEAIYRRGKHVTRPMLTSPLVELDRISIEAHQEAMREGLSPDEARQAIMPTLKAHRCLGNKDNGYPILNTNPDSALRVERKVLNPRKGDELILCSDGFSALFKYHPKWLKQAFEAPLSEAGASLRRIEERDSRREKHPRLKAHDDATAMKLSITG